MNIKNFGLIVFAIIALAAIFAFILVIGRPEASGAITYFGKNNPIYKDAYTACATLSPCPQRLDGIPIGAYDAQKNWHGPEDLKKELDEKIKIDEYRGGLYVCICPDSPPGRYQGGYYSQIYLRSPYR